MKSALTSAAALASTLCMSTVALATPLSFDFSQDLPEADYKNLVMPIVDAMRFHFIAPASPTGITGFDIGLGASFFALPQKARDVATTYIKDGKDLPPALAVPRLTVQKGLPADFDLAANVSIIPGSEIKLLGGAVQWSLFNPISPLPTISARVAYSTLLGLKTLQATNTSIEALASVGLPPGITIIEPYVGGGLGFATAKSEFSATVNGQAVSLTEKTSWTDKYALIGARVSVLPFIGIAAEAQLGSEQIYNAKLSFRF